MFKISDYVEFNKGRAACPRCVLDGKPNNKNLALVPNTDGAYKCHRGCSSQEIREAIGQPKDKIVPTALAAPEKPAQKITVPPAKVREANEKLLSDSGIRKQWLNDRGITDEMITHYRLGWVRAKIERWYFDAISVPLSINGGTSYYQKKRVSPWLPEPPKEVKEWKKWSQYGIPAQVYVTHQPDNPKQTWLCEGEWDAIRLGWLVRHSDRKNDIQVSSFSCGSGNVPPQAELDRLLGDVIVFYDLDEAGATGQEKVCKALGDRAKIAIVPYPPEFEQGWDVSNAIDYGFTLEDFVRAAGTAKGYELPPVQSNNPLRERLVWNDDLMARAADYTEWLVPDLLTSNELFLLAAGPRAGKSLLAMTLAKSVAEGSEFLGRPVTQGTVIYVCLEDGEAKLKEREQAQGWSQGLPVAWLQKFKLSELAHLKEVAEELDPRLIVLDTLSRIKDAGISESSAEMSQLLEPLQEMAKELDCCILLIHHTGKVNVENADTIDIFDTIRGSSAIRAVCRGSLIIAASDRNYRLLAENGWGKHDLNIVLDANTSTWRLLGKWAPTINGSQKDQVVEYLKQVQVATLEQIATDLNIPKRSLYQVLERLQSSAEAAEKVVKQGSRRNYTYRLALFNSIQQLNTLLNSENADEARDRGGYSTKNTFFPTALKVESMQTGTCDNLHTFKEDSPDTFVEYGQENGSNLDAVTVSPIQQLFNNPAEITDSNPVSASDTGDECTIQQQFNSNSTRSQHDLESMQIVTLTGTVPLEVGDKVEILTGRFAGKPVFVEAVLDGAEVEVKAQSWYITRTYKRSELRFLDRPGLNLDYEGSSTPDEYK